jgi:hypothetical protein
MSEQESTTVSIALDDMTLDQLVQLQQGLGRQVDALREKRAYLKAKIDERLANGERNKPAAVEPGDAVAPGAEIAVASSP